MKKKIYYVTRFIDGEIIDVIYIGYSQKKAEEIAKKNDNPSKNIYCDWGIYEKDKSEQKCL